MGHRHLSNESQFLGRDQGWGQSHVAVGLSNNNMGREVAPENGSFFHLSESAQTSGLNSASQRHLENGQIEVSSRIFRLEHPQVCPPLSAPSYDVPLSAPAYDTSLHFPSGSIYPAPESNAVHAHSSHYNRHNVHEVEGGLADHTLGIRRESFKRKSPIVSASYDRGSTSRSYDAGSSSNSFECQPEKPTLDYRNHSSIGLPPYRGGRMSIGSENSLRNVRSRTRLNLESNPRRTYLSSYSSLPYRSTPRVQNYPGNITNLNPDATVHEHNHVHVSPSAHGGFQSSANNSLSHDMNQYFTGRNIVDIGRNHYVSSLRRNPVSPRQYLRHSRHPYSAREALSNYSHSFLPTYRNDVRSTPLGRETAASANAPRFLSESHPSSSRYPRPLSAGGWHRNYREGRSRIDIDRFQSLSNMDNGHGRIGTEALFMLDRSYLLTSRNLFDQYRDMRLDTDNMNYEELLALGERIGSVNTGLSEDMISKSLTETAHSSSYESQEEASCAICLEEYKITDKVGTVKNCGHDYHLECIKKWLSMKNACPICKAPALADS